MLLYVMRHGPAEDRAPSGRDVDRRLTTPGREAVERVAERLRASRASLGSGRIRVVSSPLVRARETAEIVWRIAGHPAHPIEEHDDLSTEASTPIDLATSVVQGGVDAVLVGHNPNVEELLREIARPAPGFAGFRTATVAAVEVASGAEGDVGRWSVVAVLAP